MLVRAASPQGIVVSSEEPRHTRPNRRWYQCSPRILLLFVLVAGAALGLIGLIYLLSRTAGLMGGAWLGARIGKAVREIRKYLGMGILSQAGVAIGLSIIVKHEFSPLSPAGAQIGSIVINTITATCIIFEIVGPLLTKLALKKAGEINA